MKSIKLLIVGIAAALCAPGRYTTANAAADPAAAQAAQLEELQRQLAEQKELISQLQNNAAKPAAEAPAGDSELARLAKGAGLEDLSDVSWRIRAGLSPKQAVDAAVAQIADNKARAEREEKEKAEAAARRKK